MHVRFFGYLFTAGLAIPFFFFLSGCGGTLYAVYATSTSSRVEEAKAAGAVEYAPYLYYLAQEHMKKASEEASRAEYGDALHLIKLADHYAEQAIETSRTARSSSTLPQ